MDELERTIFKSVARREQVEGVLPAPPLLAVDQLSNLLVRILPEPNWLVLTV